MKDKEYIMIGSPIITREIFRNVLRPLNNYSHKPSGGFWACELISNIGNISNWLTYLQDADSIARYKDINKSTIFTLKENSKILVLDSKDKIIELSKKYPSYHYILGFKDELADENTIFDFEKISQCYDGIYVNLDRMDYNTVVTLFDNWCVSTLLLFNLDCIKEYKTAPIIFDIDNPYSFPYIKPSTIKETQKVEKESYEHQVISKRTEELYSDLISTYINYPFKDYDEYLTVITKNVSTVMKIIADSEETRINKIVKFLDSKGMFVRREHIIQNFVLDYIAKYLVQDEERIKTLSRSKIKEAKRYIIG